MEAPGLEAIDGEDTAGEATPGDPSASALPAQALVPALVFVEG